MNTKNLVQRSLVAAFGLILCGIGVGVFLYSNLGVDPASVFMLGLGNIFHLSYGVTSMCLNIVILLIVFFIDRKFINISSILAIFLIGFTADLVSRVIGSFVSPDLHIAVRVIMILVGCAVMSCGIATYIRADLGVGAIDLISEIISRRIKKPYRWVRIAADVSLVLAGFLLGGIVGVGTLVAAFLTGPMVQFFRPFVFKMIDPILGINQDGTFS